MDSTDLLAELLADDRIPLDIANAATVDTYWFDLTVEEYGEDTDELVERLTDLAWANATKAGQDVADAAGHAMGAQRVVNEETGARTDWQIRLTGNAEVTWGGVCGPCGRRCAVCSVRGHRPQRRTGVHVRLVGRGLDRGHKPRGTHHVPEADC